jgi:hypothetical protein
MEHSLALAGADMMMSLVGAGALVVIGFFLILKIGNKLGWLFVVAAAIWAFYTLQPTIQDARRSPAGQPGQDYYRRPPGK